MTHDAQATHGRNTSPDEQYDLNEQFYLACGRGDYPLARELYGAGADVNFHYGSDRTTPLHNAATTDNAELAAWLIDMGADPRAATTDGNTPLHQAAWHSTVEMVDLLVRHKADVNATTKQGMPVIHRAITGLRDSSAKLQYLIIHGARTDVPNFDGQPIAEKIKFHGKEQDLIEGTSLKQARRAQMAYLHQKRRQPGP